MRRLFVLWLLVLAACGGKDSGPNPLYDVSSAPARYRAVAEAFAKEAKASGAPGAVLGIVEDGKLAYAVGVGRKDPRGAARMGADTLLRIGSCTKMMTALAVLQEVQAGRLGLDDAVASRVPGFHLKADDVSGITVRQLLEHASGIAEYLEIDASAAERTDAALGAFFSGRFADLGYLSSPPGRFYNYSNPGYMLAGLAAETTSGLPYRQLLEERVLAPLGMTRTFLLPADVLGDGDFAVARTGAGLSAAYVEPGAYDNGWARPAGYAWSSVADLARFAAFVMDGAPGVLSPQLHTLMTSPSRDTQELLDLVHYGYGLQELDGFGLASGWYGVKVLAHDGSIPGFSANVFTLPTLRFGVITLASGDGVRFDGTLVAALSALPALPAPTTAPTFTPDVGTFGEEAGTYEDPHFAGTVTVTFVNGELRVSIPEATAAGYVYDPVLVPLSPRNFLLRIAGTTTQVTFIHEGPGQPTWLRTREFVARRAP
ncbi:MAG: serine hydrolase domain-containing protein [Anaeromyxobacteraceae bacterium]